MSTPISSNNQLDQKKDTVRILAVDDDEFALENMVLGLDQEGYRIDTAATASQALELVRGAYYNIVITDVKLPREDGITLVERCQEILVDAKYIVITGYTDEASVIRALKLGVNEFLKKPYRNLEMATAVRRLLKAQRLEVENRQLRERLERENELLHTQVARNADQEVGSELVVGESSSIAKCKGQARKVAEFGVNALIRGESGTGKEVFAQYIHLQGSRSTKPFVPVNCAAFSATLIESELFGYEKGAFTGAAGSRAGLFEVANGGLLFLDEFTELAIEMQAKLLRVVETQQVRRLGSAGLIDIDVQIVCATNRNIAQAIEEGYLREDLYHRLATTEIVLPPLRTRMEDFDLLLGHFIKLYQGQFDKSFPPLDEAMRSLLHSQSWGGNVRQLANFVKKWFLFGDSAGRSDVEQWLNVTARTKVSDELHCEFRYDFVNGTIKELEEAKMLLVRKILQKFDGNKSAAARHLGLSYPGLLKMLRGFERKQHENEVKAD